MTQKYDTREAKLESLATDIGFYIQNAETLGQSQKLNMEIHLIQLQFALLLYKTKVGNHFKMRAFVG